jgi:hypothetical protein
MLRGHREVSMRALPALAVALGLIACGEPEAALPPPEPAQPPAAAPAAAPARGDLSVPPPQLPRGLLRNEPGAAPGYVMFQPSASGTIYLVGNDGQVVHVWQTSHAPGGDFEMLPNGHVLRGARDPEQLGFKTGGTGGLIQEIDWDGNVVWEWKLSDASRVQHHDVTALPNGNVLLLAWEAKSPEEARRKGRRPDRIPEPGLWVDYVLEIEPVRPRGANVVWEWHVWDHLIQSHDPAAEGFAEPAARPERIDVNGDARAPSIDAAQLEQLKALGYVPPDATPQDVRADFLHVNAVAYHPRLDQIALSVPTFGEIWIIDHGASTQEAAGSSGDLLYRWGNPSTYGRGGPAEQRLFYQHDVRWIPDGAEGAGNLTVFNNGRERPEGPWSSVDEWTPPLGADGRYRLEDGEPFAPAALAWQYRAADPTRFYAPFISGAHRLANGNTLIAAGTGGEVFEVTRAGEVVWEYRNPFWGDVRNADGSPPQPRIDERPFALFRATRIAADHPGLAGRTLAPLEPQPAWFDWKPDDGRGSVSAR